VFSLITAVLHHHHCSPPENASLCEFPYVGPDAVLVK
jgi:hypothetical protein